jgi:DnaK suppressor protein
MSNIVSLTENRVQDVVSSSETVDLPRKKKDSRQEKIQHLKRTLLQARSVILEELSPPGSSLTESHSEVGADVLDRSACDLERTLRLLLRERGRTKLNAIEDALERIQEGTFGVCDDCGEKIPVGRLEVMPFATRCRDCKSIQERHERLFSSNDESDFYED